MRPDELDVITDMLDAMPEEALMDILDQADLSHDALIALRDHHMAQAEALQQLASAHSVLSRILMPSTTRTDSSLQQAYDRLQATACFTTDRYVQAKAGQARTLNSEHPSLLTGP